MAQTLAHTWRLTVLWRGTVLDALPISQNATEVRLPDGLRWQLAFEGGTPTALSHADVGSDGAPDGEVVVPLRSGEVVGLPHTDLVLRLDADVRAPRAFRPWHIDTTLLHAGMLAVAFVTVAGSALWLHPVDRPGDPGAGIPAEARQWLRLSGGHAPTVGRPSLAINGRPLELGERFTLRQRAGTATATPTRGTQRPSVDAAIAALKDALHGDQGRDSDRLGALARQVAAAPVLGAGVGGLSPRDPLENGAGNGALGAGETIKVRVQRLEPRPNDEDTRDLPPRTRYPVQMLDVPDADVEPSDVRSRPTLDPVVMDHLGRAVRQRHNVVRACFEAWGLAADPTMEGRVILELTLDPDGHVRELSTTSTSTGLAAVGHCIERGAADWYLGDGLVDEPVRLAFPFNLKPRR